MARRLAPFILLLVAGLMVRRDLASLDPIKIGAALEDWGLPRVIGAAALTVASFVVMTAAEWLGLRWAQAKVPLRTVLVGSFSANAFGHVLGYAPLVGGAVRLRLYARAGASLLQVGQVSAFCSLSSGLGLAALAGLSLIAHPDLSVPGLSRHFELGSTLGIALTAIPILYVIACAIFTRAFKIASHEVTLPSPGIALAQVALGLADMALTGMLVWLLLDSPAIGFAAFAPSYVIATLAGVVSGVPGGAGVFEGVVIALLPDLAQAPLVAALLGYRLIYYLVPLAIAAVFLVHSAAAAGAWREDLRRIWRGVAPPILACAAFTLGAALILTGVGRIAPDRLSILRASVPTAVLETSNLLCLICGLALMAAAPLLMRRHATAAVLTMTAALVGSSTALLRGLDIGPAIAALALSLTVLMARPAFTRRGPWHADRSLPWWLGAMAAVVLGALALGLWIYGDTPYETRLWTQVGYHADPGRFLRNLAVAGAALLVFGVSILARTDAPPTTLANTADVDAIRAVVEAQPDTTARLALIGDKALLRSDGGDAFIMYRAEGRSLIAMGDPVGHPDAAKPLLWRFKELARERDARPVIYHASALWLPEYLDLGLAFLKLGEEARVPLAQFDLEGPNRRKLRQSHARALRTGLSFDILHPPQSDAFLGELQGISDLWLTLQGGREKGFSLGRFDPANLRSEPIAIVRHGDVVVAFADIWTGGREEASVDLMRHLPDAPHGVMEFLFVELILWARSEGFQWFNLGMAPLSGLAQHPLAPMWHKIGDQIARRGGRFYGFTGLRAFKAKFDPVWTPRYLAAPPTALAAAMLDATRLVARASPSRLKGS
jgi:phosphatidylglycerol lysyltransferase